MNRTHRDQSPVNASPGPSGFFTCTLGRCLNQIVQTQWERHFRIVSLGTFQLLRRHLEHHWRHSPSGLHLVEHTTAVTVGVGAEFAGIIHTIAVAVGGGAVRNGDRATGVLSVDRARCIVIAFPEFNDDFVSGEIGVG